MNTNRYFKSGYNYIQEMLLEANTYTLVAYVKSMYSDVYVFSLYGESGWEQFEVSVKQGEWCKVYRTFTIDETKTKLNLIDSNYSADKPVFVFKPQLTLGNVPVDAGASPFDLDQILDDLHDQIDGIADFTNEAFKDRIVTESERVALERDLDTVESIFISLKGSYDKLKINPFISTAVKNDLRTKYNTVESAKNNLINTILDIIADGKITDYEIGLKDNAFKRFNSALYNYNLAEKNVYNAMGDDYTEKINAVKGDLKSTNDATNNLKTYVDGAFKDGVIDDAEAKAIEKYINIVQTEKAGLEATYNKLIDNSYLKGSAKSSLLNAKISYFGTVNNLLQSINTAIADGKATKAEKQDVDRKYSLYKDALADLRTAVENANKSIQEEIDRVGKDRVDNLEIGSRNYIKNSATSKELDAGSNNNAYIMLPLHGHLEDNTTYTFQSKVEFLKGSDTHVSVYGVGGVDSIYIYKFTQVKDNKITVTFQGDSRVDKLWVYVGYAGRTANKKIRLTKYILVEGNKVAGWLPSPSDFNYQINKSAAITDKFGTTVEGGLISTVQMQLREADTENVTAGTSGIQRDRSGVLPFGYMPAYWSGGTYEQAINFGRVFKAMEDGTTIPNLPMANIVHLHCGASRQGDLIIDKSGNIRTLSGKFEVVNGKFKAEDASIKGEVTASSGKIGYFSLKFGSLTAGYDFSGYLGNVFTQGRGSMDISPSRIILRTTTGGTAEYPMVSSWETLISPDKIKVGDMEVRRDGIYKNGQKVL